jgi:hypothetical protein
MKASHVTNILLLLIAATQFLILRNANKPETPANSSPLEVAVVETVGYRGGLISVEQHNAGGIGIRPRPMAVEVTNWPLRQKVEVTNTVTTLGL